MNSNQSPHCILLRISLFLFVGIFLILGLFASHAAAGDSPQTTQTPSPTPLPDIRLAKPVLLPNVTDQVNRGALKYWGVCMACHGDRGQGLTDEWRAVYGEDSNCWTSGCHDKKHPPQGFEIPKTLTIPAIAGPGRLGRFANAQQLLDFIHANMPWWKPGSLSSDDAWALTAQILRMNGTLPNNLILGPTNATAVNVHYLASQPTDNQFAAWVLVSILGFATLGLIAQYRLEKGTDTEKA